jgi:regulator of sigma E protease
VALYSREHMVTLLQGYTNQPIALTVERQGAVTNLSMTPIFDYANSRLRIGIQFDPVMATPLQQLKSDTVMVARLLKALTSRKQARHAAQNVGSPIMIFVVLFGFLQVGLLEALGILRMINVNLAILNILPIPVLDGGHIVFALWQWVTRRPVPAKVAEWLIRIFVTLLIALFAFLMYRDVFRLWAMRRDLKAAEEQAATNAVAAPPAQPAGQKVP